MAEPIAVPSGREIVAIEYLSDEDASGPVLRARYHAPNLMPDTEIDGVLNDMAHLCESDATELRATMEPAPERIIVSLSSEPVEFGEINAEVTQFFEAYRVEAGRCIWELY